MCLATGPNTSRLDKDLQTPGAQLGAILQANNQDVARSNIMKEQKQRDDLRSQNAALAAQRAAAIAQQQQQQRDMQKQLADLVVAQGKEAAELQAQQAARVAGIQTAGSAVTQSLQILGRQQTKQGPTASVAKKPGTQVAGRRTAARSLQIGSTSSTPGAGPNLSV